MVCVTCFDRVLVPQEQIFNQFASQQEEEVGAVSGMIRPVEPVQSFMEFTVPDGMGAGTECIIRGCAPTRRPCACSTQCQGRVLLVLTPPTTRARTSGPCNLSGNLLCGPEWLRASDHND